MNISVAIPDSCLKDEATKLDKSRKVSLIARSCAIFGVKTIYIYGDGANQNDRIILSTILRYLETPQYLRRILFPKMDELRYAGILHPLQIPHHSLSSNPKDLKEGDIREGAIIFHKGKKFVDIGIGHLIPYYGKEHDKKRITVQIKSVLPISIKEVPDGVIEQYWGYKVKERPNLIKLLDEWNGEIILTSKKAKYATRQKLEEFLKDKRQLLLVFGAPDRGLYDVLGKKINQIPNSAILNFFPVQSTATIRMEEALLGILSVLNFENVN